MCDRWDNLDFQQEAANLIESHESQIVGYNQSNLHEGLYKELTALPPYKSPYYAKKKLQLNPLGVTDLRVTGEYYKSLTLVVDKEKFTIVSSDPKDERLTELYGEDIKGISDADKIEFGNNVVQPGIVDYIKRETGAI